MAPGGGKLGVMGGGNLYRGEFPLPGGAETVYSAATLQYLVHSDNLGSGRLATTPSGGLYSSSAYAPYGEAYSPVGAEGCEIHAVAAAHMSEVWRRTLGIQTADRMPVLSGLKCRRRGNSALLGRSIPLATSQ